MRPSTVDFGHARGGLQLQAADALHEELVDVRAGDGQELDALEQRVAVVLGLGEHAAVEVEPGELAIEVQLGAGQVGRRRAG